MSNFLQFFLAKDEDAVQALMITKEAGYVSSISG